MMRRMVTSAVVISSTRLETFEAGFVRWVTQRIASANRKWRNTPLQVGMAAC